MLGFNKYIIILFKSEDRKNIRNNKFKNSHLLKYLYIIFFFIIFFRCLCVVCLILNLDIF